MSRGRPVLAAVPEHEEARWRAALALRMRPEFRVDRYLPPREHLVLYGPHCSVAGCDRPGNERFVGPARLCERHARIWVRVRGVTIEAWLAEAPEIRRRSDATGMPRYDLTSESPVRRDELRFLLQSLHDGRFTLTFSTKRWNALRAVYRDRESLLDWDLAEHPDPAVVATGSAKRFQLGVAVGTLIRNQVGAIAALLAYGLLVDAMLFAAVPSAGRWLPGKAGDALTGLPVDDLLAPGVGAAVLVAWTVALLVAATVRNDRTDV